MTAWLPSLLNERAVGGRLVPRVRMHDITLREGQQAAEIAFSLADKVALAERLADAGVQYAQAGFAGADDEAVRALKKAGVPIDLSVLLVAFKDDWREALAGAVESGADVIQVLVRSGDAQLETMGVTRADALRQTEQVTAAAVAIGREVWYIPSFGTVADERFLLELYRVAADSGASVAAIADTLGVATPEATAYLVEAVRDATAGGVVGVHCHDDFGLAIANTLAGIRAGAEIAEVTLNGYGERAGNCSLGELALALKLLYDSDPGIRLDRLVDLERFASEITGVPLPLDKPVSGKNVFAQKLDIHVALTKERAGLMEPYPPELVGNRRALRLGVGTGPVAVRAKLRKLGRDDLGDKEAGTLAELVRAQALEQKAAVEDEEFLRLVDKVLARSGRAAV